MKHKAISIIFISCVFAFAALLAGCAGSVESGDGYEIKSDLVTKDGGTKCITGEVSNSCGRTETLVFAWDILNKQDEVIGTALCSVENIADGETREFEAVLIPRTFDQDTNAAITLIAAGDYVNSLSSAAAVDSFNDLYENTDHYRFRDLVFMKAYNAELQQRIDEMKRQS